jgi:hypothetical protein
VVPSGLTANVPIRTCGRCRLEFPLDEGSETQPEEEHWWLCPTCREKLLGDTDSTDARWA